MGCSSRFLHTVWTLGPFSEGTGFGHCHRYSVYLIQSTFYFLRCVCCWGGSWVTANTVEVHLFIDVNDYS